MGNAEWLGKSSVRWCKTSRTRRKECKQRAARLRRRAERKDPENAPAKCIKGWAD